MGLRFLSLSYLADPARKRIQVSGRSRHPPQILDSCSSSQIDLWGKSQIIRLSAHGPLSNLKSADVSLTVHKSGK